MTAHTTPDKDNFVVITNREIYDKLRDIESKVNVLWITFSMVTAIATGVITKMLWE